MVNVHWPTVVAGEADIVSSVTTLACHIGGPIGVNPGEWALVYGISEQEVKHDVEHKPNQLVVP